VWDLTDGGSIRRLRVALGLTQEEFSHAIGMTVSTINRWEHGGNKPSKLARKMMAATWDLTTIEFS
jgi:DNA-binding transcriptional regulator YiaG